MLDRTLLVALALTLCTACAQPSSEPAEPIAETPATQPATTEASSAPSEPEAYTNTVRWRTASEVDNFGFDVYRGDTEDGSFARLTKTPINGAGTTDAPTAYKFVDDTIEPDRAYWYYVESISMNNQREKFTPTFCAKPKVGPNLCEATKAEDEETEETPADEG